MAPSLDDWLNDLSSSWPTSVTTPTLIGVSAALGSTEAAADGSTDGASEAASTGRDGATDAAADGAALVPPPPEQAETKMARPANRVRPKRLCMCPPPDLAIRASRRGGSQGGFRADRSSPVGTDGASYRMATVLGILVR